MLQLSPSHSSNGTLCAVLFVISKCEYNSNNTGQRAASACDFNHIYIVVLYRKCLPCVSTLENVHAGVSTSSERPVMEHKVIPYYTVPTIRM